MRYGALGIVWLLTSGCVLLPSHSLSVEMVLRRSENVARELDAPGGRAPASSRPALQPPLRQMQINSRFRSRGGSHAGVDLQAREGTPFYSAQDGIVVYAGEEIGGYGLTVIVRHAKGLATLYAHASDLRVESGERVTRGQCLGYSGETGNATGPHLHFEVREGLRPIDPLRALSPVVSQR